GNDFDASAMAAAFVEKADRGCRENVSTNETAFRESFVKVRTVSGTVMSTNRCTSRKERVDEIDSPLARAWRQLRTCCPGPIKKLFCWKAAVQLSAEIVKSASRSFSLFGLL